MSEQGERHLWRDSRMGGLASVGKRGLRQLPTFHQPGLHSQEVQRIDRSSEQPWVRQRGGQGGKGCNSSDDGVSCSRHVSRQTLCPRGLCGWFHLSRNIAYDVCLFTYSLQVSTSSPFCSGPVTLFGNWCRGGSHGQMLISSWEDTPEGIN